VVWGGRMTDRAERLSAHGRWRALTLAERLAAVEDEDCIDHLDEWEVRRRLDHWRGIPPFDDVDVVAAQLSSLGTTEKKFVAALSAQADVLASAVRWSDALWDVDADAFRSSTPPEPAVVEPLVHVAREHLRARVADTVAQRTSLPFDPGNVDSLFDNQLQQRLLEMLNRTLVLELHVARLDGKLAGATPEERFRSFVEGLCEHGALRRLLGDYPVLERRLARCVQQWVEASAEILERLAADSEALRAEFFPGQTLGTLQSVSADLGDHHGNGRSVRILLFTSGARVVYKPRPLGIGRHWNALLDWSGQNGFAPGFRTVRYVEREKYGWMEFVATRPCRSPHEVRRFYERQGGYIALLYLLGATDFHHENVIAAGDQPVLVDLEGLLGAAIPEPKSARSAGIVDSALANSVLRTGLLPIPWGQTSPDAGDLSGLGAIEGQPTPFPVGQWDNVGTDEMRFVHRPVAVSGTHHRPTLNGEPIDLVLHADAIVDGFRQAYRMLLSHRDKLLAPEGPLRGLEGEEVRVILRSTRTYALLLEGSLHPDVLRDALDCDWLFSRLWLSVTDQPAFARVIAAEQRALWRGDVPRFVTRAESRDVWTCSGDRISEFLSESPLDSVQRNINRLTPKDLEQQTWLIRASLVTACTGLGIQRPRRALPEFVDVGDADPGQAIAAAVAIGDRLETLAVRSDGGDVAWAGLRLADDARWSVAPIGPEMYDGTAGIALFFAYLAQVTRQDRYTSLAHAAFRTVCRQLADTPGMRSVGAFDGLGGIIYVLSHLAALWRRPDLIAEATELAIVVGCRVENDMSFDVVSGAAGAIAGLASLAAIDPSGPALDIARRCGDHLIARATPMTCGAGWINADFGGRALTGFSHGAAGIAWALSLLATLSGDERYRDCGLAAVEYERHLFDPVKRNWPDLRNGRRPATLPGRPEAFLTAWCHGAPGIALARLHYLREGIDETAMQAEVEAAIATTIAEGFGDNHSLCHGDLGNLDVLIQAEERASTPALVNARHRATALVLESLRRDGWLCGIPLDIESPGLMTGIAGIGYGLLRLAAPRRVPSVLALAPPCECFPAEEVR